jgi:hypothetical protein
LATKVSTPLCIESLSSAPSSPAAGWAYFDTTQNQYGVYNGTAWTYLPAGLSGIKLPAASVSIKPANPTGTSGTAQLMMGLGAQTTPVAYTPSGGGKVIIIVTGVLVSSTASSSGIAGGRYGTGAAPVNGAANTGTAFGPATDASVRSASVSATNGAAFVITDRLSLTPGTTYWFDLSVGSITSGDTVAPISICAVIAEQLA